MTKRRRRNRKSQKSTIQLSPETQYKLLSGQQKSKLPETVSQPSRSKSSAELQLLEKYLDSDSILSTLNKQLAKLEKELNGIKRIYDYDIDSCLPFQKARWLIYEGVLNLTGTITIHDFLDGNLFSKDIEARKQIRLGGQMLYDEGGMSDVHGMHDTLFWLFIPDAFERTVEFLWHGIGDWKA
ncbi:hypothetical protein [Crocosphaera chwakensis]|uniref:Uncharacterized protein n=1 Tax=Crocosphaera chwakensis CCY0110 TaxID=391612 RepID=A3IU07_9CHRO|nr:hypothetical protein [Crocosphaera chwakensis]EAZ90102.1 hypothetical protein CY0110_15190 [Crocosphaera chwakensis CCY0110]